MLARGRHAKIEEIAVSEINGGCGGESPTVGRSE